MYKCVTAEGFFFPPIFPGHYFGPMQEQKVTSKPIHTRLIIPCDVCIGVHVSYKREGIIFTQDSHLQGD